MTYQFRVAAMIFICFCLSIVIGGCSREGRTPMTKDTRPIQVGGLYTIQDPDGSWRVIKVLAVDDIAVHLRSYANRFPEQPKEIDPANLTLGGINDPAGFGMGHIPLAKEGFFKENPVLIKVVPVKEEELEGYKLYLDSMKRGQ